ncbi:toll/interleukin-1 receptor domain-containing protein [Segetibacter aerophilus]|uniref:TIR domain-containing protein n=1 Tax=Segetibacter aerophilus TaxID=670293 RepID=A0A512BCI3_9BACT|nr:toll/interleukin-1 receptor domain-containing protein [Segetibacter aerophilus]GEO09672.1 hypothetical protein SAE01_21680 [Segetibacter aerophilus]
MQSGKFFISYSRKDSEFVKRLAIDLKKAGEDVWLDQLDIAPGVPWDECIQKALSDAEGVIVILSEAFVKSANVMDEVSYAMSKGKRIYPLMVETCPVPFRLARLQYIDFTGDYDSSFEHLLKAMNAPEPSNFQPSAEQVATTSAEQEKKRPKKLGKALPVVFIIIALLVVFALFKNKGTNDPEDAVVETKQTEQSAETNNETALESKGKDEGSSATNSEPAVATKTGRINLLDSENGGELLVASNDNWKYSIDHNEDEVTIHVGEEAVYGFKNERAATFDMFTMLIARTTEYNVKEFELLVGNDKPLGTFESIGKFQPQNIKLFKTPYQEFSFPPVTAKYLKIKIIKIAGEGSSGYIREVQLFGKIK